jgi:hypothetical protein
MSIPFGLAVPLSAILVGHVLVPRPASPVAQAAAARRGRVKQRVTDRGLERSGAAVRDAPKLTNRPRRLTKRDQRCAVVGQRSIA